MKKDIFEIKLEAFDGSLGVYAQKLYECKIETTEVKQQLDKVKHEVKQAVLKEISRRKNESENPMDIVSVAITFRNITANSHEFTVHTLLSTENRKVRTVDRSVLWKGEFINLV